MTKRVDYEFTTGTHWFNATLTFLDPDGHRAHMSVHDADAGSGDLRFERLDVAVDVFSYYDVYADVTPSLA